MKKITRKEECVNEAMGHLYSLVSCTNFCGDVSKAIDNCCGSTIVLSKTGKDAICDDIVARYNTAKNPSMGKFGKIVKNRDKHNIYQKRYFGYMKTAVEKYGKVAGIPQEKLYEAFNRFVEHLEQTKK
jgi:hypothetical protein